MFDLDSIQEIWATITRNKARSIFTAFGVFWGMIMLMVLLGCGLGLERTMLSKWGDTSTNAAFFFQGTTSKPYKGFKKGRKVQFKMDDIDALRHKFSEIDKCSPIVWSSAKKVLYLDKSTTGINMMGLASDYNSINPCKLIEGRFLNHIDEVQSRKVCVIGSKVKNDLYGASDARGTIIWINGAAYTVIGVMEKMADINLFGSPEESIYVPYTTLAQTSNKGDKIDCISLAARKNVNIEDFQKDVASYLKEIHSVDPDDEQGIGMFNTKQFFDLFSMLFLGIRILIWIVGLGTLTAGMVGISNIMLVTVKERTQEIGVRRALGASPYVIIRQVMSESIVLALIAGLLGLMAGVLISAVADNILSSQPADDQIIEGLYVPFNVAIGVLIVLVLSGLLSGLMPAYRAIKIKAIDALRDE